MNEEKKVKTKKHKSKIKMVLKQSAIKPFFQKPNKTEN